MARLRVSQAVQLGLHHSCGGSPTLAIRLAHRPTRHPFSCFIKKKVVMCFAFYVPELSAVARVHPISIPLLRIIPRV